MTQRDSLQTIHEPFGDAFYYGPERMGSRFEDDEDQRLKSGFADSTFKTILDRIEREGKEVCLFETVSTSVLFFFSFATSLRVLLHRSGGSG